MVSSTIIPGLLLLVAINLSSGFYIQPEVLFLSEHPESQQVVAGSGLSLSCSVQLRGLSEEEGGLNVPIVWWSFNHSSVSSVFPEAVESSNRSSHQFLRSTLHISHTSPNHTGTYHCNIEDGTDKGELRRLYSHLCTNHACHPFITASNPATITVLANSTVEAMVEVQNDNSSAPPVLISPHNGTTLTTITSHPSQHTLSCSVQPPYNSHFWVYNGEIVPELSGEVVNVSSVGVYQCFAGNNFGFSVATVRLVPAGLTNPPGQPHFYEIPRPDSEHRPAYVIWWHPPSYPSQLDTDVTYSLSIPIEPTRSNSTEVFIPFDSYYDLSVIVVDGESELSEWAPGLWHRFDDSQCRKQVYFPPRLSANCDEGQTNVSWINNGRNWKFYKSPLHSTNGPVPGLYYINVTCSLPDNTVFVTGGVFTEEGSTVFEEELPIGTECVFKGAATPATGNGPAICLDPTTILYDNTSTCLTTAYIQFENDGYVAKEEDTSKVVCMNSRGYNFSAEVTATYESNTTEVMGVEVSVAGDSVCVSVEIVDDSAVSGTTNISLSLQSNSARVTTGPPVVLSILDNDKLLVVFTNNSYEVVEGGSVPVCLKTDDDLRRSVLLTLTVESSGDDVHTESELILDAENRKMCILFNTSDNSYVEGGRSYTVRVNTSDEAVNLPLFEATVNVYDDDVAEVHFTETEYRNVEGRLFELCVETADDLRTLIHLNLTIDGFGREQLLLPGSFSLGPGLLRSCRISSSQDNNAVDSSRIYTMMLQTHDSFIDVSSSETYLIIENDDVAQVHFAETGYRMVEGRSFELCVETGDDLQISIQLNLTIDGIGGEQLSLPGSFSLGPGMLISCRISSSQDNNAVDSNRIYTMMLQTHDSFIDVSSSETYLIIENDDVEVHFTETEYRSVEGRSFELCVETGDDLRTFIQLILIIDGTSKEQLSFPESFMLGPSTIRSCQDADSQDNDVIDNDRIYTMTLQTLDSFVRVPTSETYLIIENNDTVVVGFFETSYEMHAGELKRVCVQAVGKLQKSVSVNLSVRETTGADAHDYVDLDEYEILTFFPNDTACVWLNASSAITETTLLILELSGGKDVDFENGTASVTITPTPGITSPQQVSVSVIVVSILVPSILVLLICVVCVVLLRQHQNASVSARDVILPTKPFEFKEEMLEPRLLHFGSVPTVFEEPLALSPGETSGKMGLVDAVSVSSTDELQVMPELVTGSGGEREVEENDEVEGTSALSPVVKTLHTSHSDTSTATTSHSLCNKSVSNSSHHEYIASDSIMQYSYPPSVNGCGFHTAVELKTANDQCSSTLLRPVQNSPTNKSSGIGSAGFGTDNSGDVGLDFGSLGMERESGLFEGQAKDGRGSMGLLNDADMSAFFAPVVDSGIGMDVDGHGT